MKRPSTTLLSGGITGIGADFVLEPVSAVVSAVATLSWLGSACHTLFMMHVHDVKQLQQILILWCDLKKGVVSDF